VIGDDKRLENRERDGLWMRCKAATIETSRNPKSRAVGTDGLDVRRVRVSQRMVAHKHPGPHRRVCRSSSSLEYE